jgi:anti-anti-sigma factor
MPDENILLEHRVDGELDIVRFTAESIQDDAARLLLQDELDRILDAHRDDSPAVCIDFSPVRFMATTVLAKLVSFYKKVRARKGRLILCGLRPPVADVFRLTSFSTLFTIVPDVETALRKLRK